MKGPLDGITVLEVGHYVQGPFAATMLGELGADVIKIEQPGTGDLSRQVTEISGVKLTQNGLGLLFEQQNSNKRGITLNLKAQRGKDILYRLVHRADVFVQSLLPKRAEELGIDYETLRKLNPMLIYAHGTAFGSEGPEGDAPAVDATAQARSGLMWYMRDGDGVPQNAGAWASAFVDYTTTTLLAYGVLAALVARERLHIGQEVKTSLLQGAMHLQRNYLVTELWTGNGLINPRREQEPNPLYNYYQCSDGRWVVLAVSLTERHWPSFCRALENDHLEQDPRFSSREARKENCRQLIAILDIAFASRPADEWIEVLRRHEIVCAKVNTTADLERDAQVQANKYLVEFDHPVIGRRKFVGPVVELSETPAEMLRAAPRLGEHTEEVLLDLGGYTTDEIAEFREHGIV